MRALANVHLVSPLMEHDDQGHGGWADLRALDGRDVRMALAAIIRAELSLHSIKVWLSSRIIEVSQTFPGIDKANGVVPLFIGSGADGV